MRVQAGTDVISDMPESFSEFFIKMVLRLDFSDGVICLKDGFNDLL